VSEKGTAQEEKETNLSDGLHQRLAVDLVLRNTDDRRRKVGSGREDGLDSLSTLKSGLRRERSQVSFGLEKGEKATYEDTVVSDGVSTTLSVTESGDTGVETKAVGENVLDLVGSDGVEEAVVSSLSDDDDRLTLALVTVLSEEKRELRTDKEKGGERRETNTLENAAHRSLPVLSRRRALRDEHVVGAGRNGGHEGEPTAVTTHDLDNERARVGRGGGRDGVDSFADAVEGGGGT
jgi:hypothetical protein